MSSAAFTATFQPQLSPNRRELKFGRICIAEARLTNKTCEMRIAWENHMKSMIIAGAIALGGLGPVIAADLPPAPPPPRAPAAYVPAPPVYSWSGIYIGINGGYGFGQVNWLNPNTATSGNFNANGGFIGGTLGANFQASALVFGVEGDVDWSRINGS